VVPAKDQVNTGVSKGKEEGKEKFTGVYVTITGGEEREKELEQGQKISVGGGRAQR